MLEKTGLAFMKWGAFCAGLLAMVGVIWIHYHAGSSEQKTLEYQVLAGVVGVNGLIFVIGFLIWLGHLCIK